MLGALLVFTSITSRSSRGEKTVDKGQRGTHQGKFLSSSFHRKQAGARTSRPLILISAIAGASLLLFAWSCGGVHKETQSDPCDCAPTAPESSDYRTAAKHVDLPQSTPTEITVNDVLKFPQGPAPAPDAPRSGRELQVFHIANAFAQVVWLNPSDCDIHVELSATADKNAPRIIVETPHMDSYCASRRELAAQFNAHGLMIDNNRKEVDPPIAVEVLGLAFQDVPHSTRGSAQVATVWELHPAVVTLK